MESMGLGAGLAALAFWGFIAAVVVGGMWDAIREREAQHETLRRLIESGKEIDQDLIDRMALLGRGGGGRPDRDFKITGMWILPIAVGLGIFGIILGAAIPEAKAPLVGVSALLLCMGAGFLIAAKIASRWYEE